MTAVDPMVRERVVRLTDRPGDGISLPGELPSLLRSDRLTRHRVTEPNVTVTTPKRCRGLADQRADRRVVGGSMAAFLDGIRR